ncbi:MAG: hypothetical protein J1F40_07265 [Prevotellaceae bacterium]|nr:hypothetical protein [Prevotellaceae bacterium]
MTKFIFSVKVACILCCAALWSVNSYSQTPYKKIDLGYGKWSKSWFADEFGDPMYDKPYIQSSLRYTNDNYSYYFFYIQFTNAIRNIPIFEIRIDNGKSNYSLYRETATIKIKSANGTVSTITAPIGEDGESIILGGDNAIRFAKLINTGNYSLVVSVHTAWSGNNNVSTFTFRCSNETKDFYKATKSALGYSFPTY